MLPVSDTALQSFLLQASTLRASLQFQPNVGTEAQRQRWLRILDDSETMAAMPVGAIKAFFLGDDCHLLRARNILLGVAAQSVSAGLYLAEPSSGFVSNLTRFGTPERASARAVMSLGVRPIRPESASDRAVRMVETLFASAHSPHRTLVSMLDRAFDAHIARLDAHVASLPSVIAFGDVPEGTCYPRYFENAHPHLMDYLYRTLIEIEPVQDVPWEYCRRETVGLLIERALGRERIGPRTTDVERSQRGQAVSRQIPDYGTYQLFCLLLQIRDGRVEASWVEDLKRSRNVPIVDAQDAINAGLSWKHVLRASELVGSIDIIHANIQAAYEMAEYEQPGTDPRVLPLQVRAAVARLGLATKSSRREYDDAIAKLRVQNEKNASPQATSNVIHLKDRKR